MIRFRFFFNFAIFLLMPYVCMAKSTWLYVYVFLTVYSFNFILSYHFKYNIVEISY